MKSTILLVLLALGLNLSAQNSACKAELKRIVHAMGATQFPEDGQVYRMNFSTDYTMWDPAATNTRNLNVEMLMSNEQLYYDAGDMLVLQDLKDAFIILKSQKLVMRSVTATAPNQQARINQLTLFRDSLIDQCRIERCEEVKLDEQWCKSVVLVPEPSVARKLKLVDLRIVYDPATLAMKRVTINHNKASDIKQTVMRYHIVDYDFDKGLNKPVASHIVNRNGQLLPRFKGYQLLDHRN